MNSENQSNVARSRIAPGSDLVERHLETMQRMVAVDSRSFNVNEFPGDRTQPSDMQEILNLASEYLTRTGFDKIHINDPGPDWPDATPILMAELTSGEKKPTVLLYAHLDKQPYMDDNQWKKWDGIPPTELRWNEDRTRAYGRGAADDLSGVVAIGMAVEAVLRAAGWEGGSLTPEHRAALPCNLKIIYETEEESGSHSLIAQILQNKAFFSDCHCVIITDVTNPDTGTPGLTTSLRGIVQMAVTLHSKDKSPNPTEQTALYRLLASLIHDDHSLAVKAIAEGDVEVTPDERRGYELIPTDVASLRESAGLLAETRAVVPETVADLMQSLLRTSYVNVRPGHRVAGGVVFGVAGARLTLPLKEGSDPETVRQGLLRHFQNLNPFHLRLAVEMAEAPGENLTGWDVLLQSADKDPHSGINGGPFPIPELQLARMITSLFDDSGNLSHPDLIAAHDGSQPLQVHSLHVEQDGTRRLFDQPEARAVVEIRLAPGHDENAAAEYLKNHLLQFCPEGFYLEFEADKGGPPWMTGIEHPVFPQMLEALEAGYGKKPCLYGCGGSIPFVAKLMGALENCPPLCLGAYDPDCRMHEPNESLSMTDLLGCARSIVDFMYRTPTIFREP